MEVLSLSSQVRLELEKNNYADAKGGIKAMQQKPISIIAFTTILTLALLPAILIAGEYTIKQGDTLWDISEERMKDPFLWKKLWKANPHIKNPDLIFPGQKLNIPEEGAKAVKQEKKKIEEEIGIAAKAIAPTKIVSKNIPIQKMKYLVPKEILLQGGYISDDIKSAGKIYGSPQMKTLMGRGDYAYIETAKPAAINSKFYIISPPKKIVHPVTKDTVGYLIRITGVLETVGEDNGNKKALILESYGEITLEDTLADFYPVELPVEPVKERRPAINGVIMKLWNEYNISGADGIVYLDKGTADGIEIGDIFNIVSGEKPNIPLGIAHVISLKDKTSVALLKKAFSEIKAGDLFRN